MYDDVCYDKPFLNEVVARIDFVAPLGGLQDTLPPRLAKVLSKEFPITEPTAENIASEVQLGPAGEMFHRQTRFKLWNFFGREREKQLSITAAFMFIQYKHYKTYEDMKETFKKVVTAIQTAFPDAMAARLGIRYINSIERSDVANLESWKRYISADLLPGHKTFRAECLTRLFHVAELKFGDVDLRFQYGIPNPDYPAIMRRQQFVLDFDSYVQIAHTLPETVSLMDEAHAHIQDLFESSITDDLRELMHAKPTRT